jgi:hypothetical protein
VIDLLRQPVGVAFILVVAAYCIAAYLLPAKLLIEIGDAFAIPMSLAAGLVYFRAVLDKKARAAGRELSAAHITMLAIAGAWLTNLLDRQTRLFARLYDITITDSAIIALYLFMLTFFAALHLFAIGVRLSDDRPPMPGTILIWIALGCGAALSIFVIWSQWPDFHGAVPV